MAHARKQIPISNDVRYAEVAAMFFYEMNGMGKTFGEFLIGWRRTSLAEIVRDRRDYCKVSAAIE